MRMNRVFSFSMVLMAILFVHCFDARAQLRVSPAEGRNSFAIFYQSIVSPIVYDTADAEVVVTAANHLADDLKNVTDYSPAINPDQFPGTAIIIGTIGKSQWIHKLIESGKLDVDTIAKKRESFIITTVKNPLPGMDKALVIAGSDPRGTAYGVFRISEEIGVHPLYWWADIPIKKQKELHLSGQTISSSPSVKYRGIFLNDEDWGLQPWAAGTLEPEFGDLGPKAYARIFELLLRLKANLIWPAMRYKTGAFFSYPENIAMAKKYDIVIGSSHSEPMLRNNVGEWNSKTMGEYNYLTNGEKIYNYWDQRVKESKGLESVYTLGMRGVHDTEMEGVNSAQDAVVLLEKIISDQREILKNQIGEELSTIPQAFTAYKEVLQIYDEGLHLPEDITIVWPDDNYGYIRRLSDSEEAKRGGGSGIYYHASYLGRPHDYTWLSSTNPALIREEMMKAYEQNARNLWVLNVGDVKPLEYNLQFFLDMAYDISKFEEPESVFDHKEKWSKHIFGQEYGMEISEILREYDKLAFERRPEHMGWSMNEPKTPVQKTAYNHFFYGDEALKRIDQFNDLEESVNRLRDNFKNDLSDAFYELVYYPVYACSQMNKKFLFRDKAYWYTLQNRSSASDYAEKSMQAYENIKAETKYYNEQLAGGKWNKIISMRQYGLAAFKAPDVPSTEIDSSSKWRILPEGWVSEDSILIPNKGVELRLPPFNNLIEERYFIDVFLSGTSSLNWEITKAPKWLNVSQKNGSLQPKINEKDARIWCSLNRVALPKKDTSGELIIEANGQFKTISVFYKHIKRPDQNIDFIDSKGVVSIFAEHPSETSSDSFRTIEGLGHTGASLVNENDNPETASYQFETSTSSSEAKLIIYLLPTHPVNNTSELVFEVSIDKKPFKKIDFRTYGRSEEWKQNVLENSAKRIEHIGLLKSGDHTLHIRSANPNIFFDRFEIDLGDMVEAYRVIPETKITENR